MRTLWRGREVMDVDYHLTSLTTVKARSTLSTFSRQMKALISASDQITTAPPLTKPYSTLAVSYRPGIILI